MSAMVRNKSAIVASVCFNAVHRRLVGLQSVMTVWVTIVIFVCVPAEMPQKQVMALRVHFKTPVRASEGEEHGVGMKQTDPEYRWLHTHIASVAPGFEMHS